MLMENFWSGTSSASRPTRHWSTAHDYVQSGYLRETTSAGRPHILRGKRYAFRHQNIYFQNDIREKIVLRLLTMNDRHLSLSELGLDERQYKDYLAAVSHPHGMILISAPTGSGKSTTLYATLELLNRGDNNIVTIGYPVEYTLEGVESGATNGGDRARLPNGHQNFPGSVPGHHYAW